MDVIRIGGHKGEEKERIRSSGWRWWERLAVRRRGWRRVHGHPRKIRSSSPTSNSTATGTGEPSPSLQVINGPARRRSWFCLRISSWLLDMHSHALCYNLPLISVVSLRCPLFESSRVTKMREELQASVDKLSSTRYQKGELHPGRRGRHRWVAQDAWQQVLIPRATLAVTIFTRLIKGRETIMNTESDDAFFYLVNPGGRPSQRNCPVGRIMKLKTSGTPIWRKGWTRPPPSASQAPGGNRNPRMPHPPFRCRLRLTVERRLSHCRVTYRRSLKLRQPWQEKTTAPSSRAGPQTSPWNRFRWSTKASGRILCLAARQASDRTPPHSVSTQNRYSSPLLIGWISTPKNYYGMEITVQTYRMMGWSSGMIFSSEPAATCKSYPISDLYCYPHGENRMVGSPSSASLVDQVQPVHDHTERLTRSTFLISQAG